MLDLLKSGVGLSLVRDSIAMRESQTHGLVIADRVALPCELQFVSLAARADEPVLAAAWPALAPGLGRMMPGALSGMAHAGRLPVTDESASLPRPRRPQSPYACPSPTPASTLPAAGARAPTPPARRRRAARRAGRRDGRRRRAGAVRARAAGPRWPVPRAPWHALTRSLRRHQRASQAWDLRGIEQLDHIGAQLLWNHWGQAWPAALRTGRAAPARVLDHVRAVHRRAAAEAARTLAERFKAFAHTGRADRAAVGARLRCG